MRQELRRHVHVCSVFPAMVDTPGLGHGADVSGRRIDAGPLALAAGALLLAGTAAARSR